MLLNLNHPVSVAIERYRGVAISRVISSFIKAIKSNINSPAEDASLSTTFISAYPGFDAWWSMHTLVIELAFIISAKSPNWLQSATSTMNIASKSLRFILTSLFLKNLTSLSVSKQL